jgi:hypothetical protein
MAMRMRVTVLTIAVALLVGAAPALAQGPSNPLAPGLPQSGATVPAQTTAPQVITSVQTSSPGSSGLSTGSAFGIGVGAIVVLLGISLFIWRDARRRAPTRARAAMAGAGADGGAGSQKARQRAKPRKLSPAERRRRKRGRAR